MQHIDVTLAHNLKALANGLEADPSVAASLLAKYPAECQVIRDRLLLSSEPALSATQDLSKRQFGTTAIAAMSPDEFFAWFDKQHDALPRARLLEATEAWIAKQDGENYGIEVNKLMAAQLGEVLNDLDKRFACPGGSGPDSSCGQPAILRFDPKRRGYPEGAFVFQHIPIPVTPDHPDYCQDKVVMTSRTSHAPSRVFLAAPLIDPPSDRRKKPSRHQAGVNLPQE